MTALRRRMLEDMQVRHLSGGTQQVYLQHISRFARYFGRSPAELGPEEIRAYQLYVTKEKQLTPSTLVIVVAALRFLFLYRVTLQKTWVIEAVIPAPKKPQRVPVVLSPAEVVRLLDSVKNLKHRTILTTCYAAGLRISEAVRLTVPAIDSQRMVLRIVQGKGQRDRYVMLSPKLLAMLRATLRVYVYERWSNMSHFLTLIIVVSGGYPSFAPSLAIIGHGLSDRTVWPPRLGRCQRDLSGGDRHWPGYLRGGGSKLGSLG